MQGDQCIGGHGQCRPHPSQRPALRLQTRIAARHQAVTHKPPMSSDSKAIPIASKRMGAEGAGIVPNA
jgi:hypothetical protein